MVSCNFDNQSRMQTIPTKQVIEIPVAMIDSPDAGENFEQNPGMLAITPGYEDELPEGPTSFDVLKDGGFAISDPLQNRLVMYDSLGDYRSARMLGFSALRVKSLDNAGDLLIQRTGTEAYFISNATSAPQSTNDPAVIKHMEKGGSAKLNSQNSGTITPENGGEAFTVSFKNDSLFLASLQYLGNMENKSLVLLEATSGKTPIVIYRFLRVYDQGNWQGQIEGLAEGHLVFPEDEFRLGNGKLYQMVPGKDKLRIYVWEI